MRNSLLITAISAMLLTACATDPYTGQSSLSNTAKGAGLGAAAGAAIGAAFGGNDWKNVGYGALAGGAVGAAAGAYKDHKDNQQKSYYNPYR